jgi:hypothetical protein
MKTTMTIVLTEEDGNLTTTGTIDPPLDNDQMIFNTAQIVGLFMREHMEHIVKLAIDWAREADEPQPSIVKEPQLILPPGMLGTMK